MTKARQELVDLDSTPYYHCICRCVRRAFLCGEDHLTGINYEHRKVWVVERLSLLSEVFAIDVCAFAVMSNHYHVVLRVNYHESEALGDQEVADRWKKLFTLPLLVARYLKGEGGAAESVKAQEIIQLWRDRLIDLSWFMRTLNEFLARKANVEDRCTGRFWEGRYKSQALLDDAAVLTCMSYVDLNPVRAGIAETPEESDFTSIQQRIQAWQQNQTKEEEEPAQKESIAVPDVTPKVRLMRLIKASSDKNPHAVGYTTRDYLELVDWVGRVIRDDKRGAIPEDVPPILDRLGLDAEAFIDHLRDTKKRQVLPRAIGSVEKMKVLAKKLQQKFIRGQGAALKLYSA